MAIVPVGFSATIDLVDTSGTVSQLRYDLTSLTMADAIADAGTIPALLDPLTNATVRGINVTQRFLENAFTLPANAENAVKAEISAFIAGEGTKKATFRIPSPAIALFTSGSGAGFNVVDIGNADLLAYAGIWETGTGFATISDGEELVAPVSNALNAGRRVSVYSRNP